MNSGDGPDIGWLRASEISDEPVLFADGATRFDINQVKQRFSTTGTRPGAGTWWPFYRDFKNFLNLKMLHKCLSIYSKKWVENTDTKYLQQRYYWIPNVFNFITGT